MDMFMKHQHDAVFHGDANYVNMELKEQDFIKQLEKKESSKIGDHCSPLLDCKLTLGPSGLTSNELLYMPINCRSNSQETTWIESFNWNEYPDCLSTSNSFAAYANSSTVDASGCKMPMDFYGIPNVTKNMQGSSFFQCKENVGNGKEEGITITKKCCFCQTTTTPLWRNGPKGSKSLCNACGIRYKKKKEKH